MRKINTVLAAAIAVGAVAYVALMAGHPGEPAASFDHVECDFGSTAPGTSRQLELEIHAKMEASTVHAEVIDPIAPSPVSVEVLAGRDPPRIRVRLSESAALGRLSARILLTLESNAAGNGEYAVDGVREFRVGGYVDGPFRASPPELIASAAPPETTPAMVHVVSNDGSTDFRIRIASVSENLSGIVEPRIDEDVDNHTVLIDVDPSSPEAPGSAVRGALRLVCLANSHEYTLSVPLQLYLHAKSAADSVAPAGSVE